VQKEAVWSAASRIEIFSSNTHLNVTSLSAPGINICLILVCKVRASVSPVPVCRRTESGAGAVPQTRCAWPKWGSCSLSCQACRKKRIRSRCAASRKKCTICSGRVNRQVPLDDDAVETVIQKPGSAQRASRRFPSVASSDVWLDTKIIGPGDRWNQADCAHKPGPPRLGISRAQPLVIISRMLNPPFSSWHQKPGARLEPLQSIARRCGYIWLPPNSGSFGSQMKVSAAC
jgi:hypothetical protein